MSLFYSAGLGNAIPDSGLKHHYAADQLTGYSDNDVVDPRIDQSNGEDLGAQSTDPVFTSSSIGSNPAVVYDGSGDEHYKTSFATSLNEPLHIWAVANADGNKGGERVFTAIGPTNSRFTVDGDSDDRYVVGDSGGNFITPGSPDGNPHIFLVRFTGSSTELEIDGSTIGTGGSGTVTVDGFSIGSSVGGDYFDGPIPEVMIVDPSDPEYAESDYRSYLSDKYGISV